MRGVKGMRFFFRLFATLFLTVALAGAAEADYVSYTCDRQYKTAITRSGNEEYDACMRAGGAGPDLRETPASPEECAATTANGGYFVYYETRVICYAPGAW
jgi:hypothetical protein